MTTSLPLAEPGSALPSVSARGPLSAAVLDRLRGGEAQDAPDALVATALARATSADLLADDDVQLSLLLLHELQVGIDGVDPDLDHAPDLLVIRTALEDALIAAVRERFTEGTAGPEAPADAGALPTWLFELTAPSGPGGTARHLATKGTLQQLREMLVMRTPYQLKEADPHTFVIPRLRGRAKAALVEIQTDEYGGGRLPRMHQSLFADALAAAGLPTERLALVDAIPALVLASHNALTTFCLRTALAPAAVGHLAVYEMTSSLPMAQYLRGGRRLGLGADGTAFFDEHVEADAVHEQIAAHDLVGGLVEDRPEAAPTVVLGALTSAGTDALVGELQLSAWQQGHSALRPSPVADWIAALP